MKKDLFNVRPQSIFYWEKYPEVGNGLTKSTKRRQSDKRRKRVLTERK